VLSAVLTGFLLLLLAGCKSTTQAPGGAAVTDQQQQGMQDILNYMKEKDTSLDSLRQEIAQLRAQESDPGGVKALSEDVRVARALVGAARTAASAKSGANTQTAVTRLQAALISLRANLPAARMAEAVERSLTALESYQPQDAQNVASRDLLQATDIAMKAPATLVPTVIKDIESAKAQVDRQDLAGAKSSLLDILKRVSAEDSLQTADHVLSAAHMTQDALDLGASAVVQAQLDYMDQLLTGLQQKVEGALTPLEPSPGAATGEAAGVPATGEAAATAPAEATPAASAQPTPAKRRR
jgi:hypothetical protein